MVLTLILLFTISWSPYATVSFIGQFGDVRLLTPWVSALPALFAKASVIYNPIVYGMSHPHFRSSLQHLFSSVVSTHHNGHFKASTAARHVSVNSILALPDDPHFRPWQSDVSPSPRCPARFTPRGDSMGPTPNEESWTCLLMPELTTPVAGDVANLSEPDLLRHDDRIIPAHLVTFAAYHREKRRFLRSALFCSESSLERYDRPTTNQRPRHTYVGGGGGLLPTTTPNCVLEQTGPGTWDHMALLAPSLPLNHDSNLSVGSASPENLRRRPTIYCRSPKLAHSKFVVSISNSILCEIDVLIFLFSHLS